MEKDSILKFFGVGIALSIPDTNDPDGWLYVMPIETLPSKKVKICSGNRYEEHKRLMKNSIISEDENENIEEFEDYNKKLLSDCVGGESSCFEDFRLEEWEEKNKVKYKDMEFDLEQEDSEPIVLTKKDEKPLLSYPYIKAKWLRIGWDINRITPYHITRGEQVLLFRYGSSTEFFWLPMILPYNTTKPNDEDDNTESIYSYTNIDKRVSEDVKYEFNKVELEEDVIKKDKYKFYISPKEDRILIEHNTPISGEEIGKWKLEMRPTMTYIGEKSGTSYTIYEKKNITTECEETLTLKSNTWIADIGKTADFNIKDAYGINVGTNYNLNIENKGNINANSGLNITSNGVINETGSIIKMNCGGGINITNETVERVKKNADRINKIKAEAVVEELNVKIGKDYYIDTDGSVVNRTTGEIISDSSEATIYRSALENKLPEDMDPADFLIKTKELGLNNKYDPIPTDDKELITALVNDPNTVLYGESVKPIDDLLTNDNNEKHNLHDQLIDYIKNIASLTDDEIKSMIKIKQEGFSNLSQKEIELGNSGLRKLKNVVLTFLRNKLGYSEANDIISMAEVGYTTNPPKGKVYIEDLFLGKNLESAISIKQTTGRFNPVDYIEKIVQSVIIGSGYATLTGIKIKKLDGTKLTEIEAKAYKEYLETGSVSYTTVEEIIKRAQIVEPKTIDIRELFPGINFTD